VKLNLSGKILILVAVPLAFELAFVMCLLGLLHQSEQEKNREIYARDVSAHLNTILRFTLDITVSTMLSEIMAEKGYPSTNNREQMRFELTKERALLRQLVQGHPEAPKVAEVDGLSDQVNENFQKTREYYEQGNTLLAARYWGRVQALQHKSFAILEDLIAKQRVDQQARSFEEGRTKEYLYTLLLSGAALNVIIAIFLAYLFNKSTTRRLNILLDNTLCLAQGRPLNEPLTGDDELARLDKTFNQMASALAVAARKERAIVDKASDVICASDVNDILLRVSPASERVWGHKPASLINRDITEIIAPDDRESTANIIRGIKKGSGDATFENRVLHKDGRLVDTLWSARWSYEDKTLFCVAHDITERKQAENALKEASALIRSMVETLPIGLAIIDRNGAIEFTNPSINKLFEVSPGALVGRSIGTLFIPQNARQVDVSDYQQKCHVFVQELFSRAKAQAWELKGVKSGGKTFPAEVGLTDFEISTGARYLVVVSDVTQRQEVDRLRQEFMAMVGHDLRAPLTSVRGFLDLLGAGICGELNEKGQRKLKAADGAMDSLLTLIRDLLDIERSRAGMLTLDKKLQLFNDVVERAIESVRIQADSLNIQIVTNMPYAKVSVDGDRMVQTLVNILSNALKFSPPASTIVVAARTQGDWFEVRVTDQGRGIPEAFRDKIFDRFQQVKASDASVSVGGSGLGLAICKAIVEQHGGTIGADSKEGQGSTFWFKVPVA
jgi:PAS domain S-box-containing protein